VAPRTDCSAARNNAVACSGRESALTKNFTPAGFASGVFYFKLTITNPMVGSVSQSSILAGRRRERRTGFLGKEARIFRRGRKLDNQNGCVMVLCMASITLKDIPADLHAQLKIEADANFRSLNQEAMARIQRSFDLDERFTTEAVNRLIDEAVKSGPEKPFTRAAFDAAGQSAKEKFSNRHQAA